MDDFENSGGDDFDNSSDSELDNDSVRDEVNDDNPASSTSRKQRVSDDDEETDEGKAPPNKDKEEGEKKAKGPKMVKVGDDYIPESELAVALSKWKGANRKFQEAAEMRKSTQAFMEQLKSDPMKLLSDPRLPIDRAKLAEHWLKEIIEKESSGEYVPPDTPLGKRLAELEKQITTYKEKELDQHRSAEEQEFNKHVEKRRGELAEILNKAMESTVLSKNKETAAATLREMALYMRAAKENDVDVTPEELVSHVENKRYKEYHSLVNGFDGEELVAFLGKDIVNKIRKYDLAKLMEKRKPKEEPQGDDFFSPPAKNKERVFISPRDSLMG